MVERCGVFLVQFSAVPCHIGIFRLHLLDFCGLNRYRCLGTPIAPSSPGNNLSYDIAYEVVAPPIRKITFVVKGPNTH